MIVDYIGCQHKHPEDFHIDRPQGLENHILLLIKSPALFSVNGALVPVRKNSFVIYKAGVPHEYGANKEPYIDDFIHFHFEEGDEEYFLSHNMVFNRPVYVGELTECSEILRNMRFEFCTPDEDRAEAMNLYFRLLILKLGRAVRGTSLNSSDLNSDHFHSLRAIREKIFSTHAFRMTIDEMARAANVSRSYFQHSYKMLFGQSVRDDILQSRMSHAKLLLSSTKIPVSAISEQCGYNNDVHFMRQFKNYTGLTPTEYRKRYSDKK